MQILEQDSNDTAFKVAIHHALIAYKKDNNMTPCDVLTEIQLNDFLSKIKSFIDTIEEIG